MRRILGLDVFGRGEYDRHVSAVVEQNVKEALNENVYLRNELATMGLTTLLQPQTSGALDYGAIYRRQRVVTSRRLRLDDPYYVATLELLANFVVASGLSAPRVSGHDPQHVYKGELLVRCWNANRHSFFGVAKLRGIVQAFYQDGMLPILGFPNSDRTQWQFRPDDALNIMDVIPAPGDPNLPLVYYVNYYDYASDRTGSVNLVGHQQVRYFKSQFYDAWLAEFGDTPVIGRPRDSFQIVAPTATNFATAAVWKTGREVLASYPTPEPDPVMLCPTIGWDVRSRFGLPMFYAGVSALRTLEGMTFDLATWTKTATAIAAKKKIAGLTPERAQALKAALMTDPAWQDQTSKLWITSDKTDYEPINVPSGGTNVLTEGMDQQRRTWNAVSGFPAHFFGDPKDANRSTAFSMELPVIKMISSQQAVWRDILLDMYYLVLGESYLDDRSEIVQDFPQITVKDLATYVTSLVAAKTGEIIDDRTATELALREFEVENATNILDEMYPGDTRMRLGARPESQKPEITGMPTNMENRPVTGKETMTEAEMGYVYRHVRDIRRRLGR